MPMPSGGLSLMVGDLPTEKHLPVADAVRLRDAVAALAPIVSGSGYGNVLSMIYFILIKHKILAER
jgi:hypothetical protein